MDEVCTLERTCCLVWSFKSILDDSMDPFMKEYFYYRHFRLGRQRRRLVNHLKMVYSLSPSNEVINHCTRDILLFGFDLELYEDFEYYFVYQILIAAMFDKSTLLACLFSLYSKVCHYLKF